MQDSRITGKQVQGTVLPSSSPLWGKESVKGLCDALGPTTTFLQLAEARLSLGLFARGTRFSLPAGTALVVGSETPQSGELPGTPQH